MPVRSRILIAEDDPHSASFLQQLLEDDCDCRIACDGRQALEAAQAENFDLALVDVMMPEIDGLELCRRLRQQERSARMPIIIVTARTQAEDIVAGLQAGANDYVPKPVDPAVLRARVETQLRVAQLQRQRDELASMLTHDLKGSLALILSAVSLLRRQIESGQASPEESAKWLDRIHSNVDRMASMINNHLAISKLEGERFPLRREPFDPQQLAEELFESALDLAREKQIDLSYECAELPERIDADRENLARALNNLLGNAVKFTPKGGRVSFRVEAASDRVLFTVEDTGPGVPKELLPRIFNRYARAIDSKAEGTGLGLTIAKLVAEAHGGDVAVENRPEGGARFVLRIPVEAAPASPAAPARPHP